MKFFLISDNVDTSIGMRMAGIEGVVVHEEQEVRDAIEKACEDSEIGILLITKILIDKCPDFVLEKKLYHKYPLIVEIPDRHATSNIGDAIGEYIKDAVGIRI